jgi:hypothetical protein
MLLKANKVASGRKVVHAEAMGPHMIREIVAREFARTARRYGANVEGGKPKWVTSRREGQEREKRIKSECNLFGVVWVRWIVAVSD